jgi:hypothetical protein
MDGFIPTVPMHRPASAPNQEILICGARHEDVSGAGVYIGGKVYCVQQCRLLWLVEGSAVSGSTPVHGNICNMQLLASHWPYTTQHVR